MAKNLQRAERKRQIKQAAIKLMSARGYKDIGVQDIIDEINYSKGGFYHCYASKEALFKEILKDGMEYRYQKVRSFKDTAGDIDKSSFVIETLLDKILDYNDYKKLFVALMVDISNDADFLNFYNQSIADLTPQFFDFCDEQGMSVFKTVVDDEFNALISTLVLGAEIFKLNDNLKYRALLKEIFSAYFAKKQLFSEQ